ncbi:hypothetical protein E0Z10_g6950 [Xylaria hypoxylon]|uniref:BZIP domain-containing protein n=1 Tax=Xylaria hypoxylon TaxID=37992 RepID=A0A4Z0YTQ2_9PEZI|nr:hypothetical protein E0Z10_g6950 [Xylaria hypoxylon]
MASNIFRMFSPEKQKWDLEFHSLFISIPTRFVSVESKEDRAKKRKAQLRNAQLLVLLHPPQNTIRSQVKSITDKSNVSTYRERKERYTKALEEHAAEARANEAGLYQEIHELRRTVQQLTKLIRDHGMQIPDEIYLPVDLGHVSEDSPAGELLSQQDGQPSVQHAGGATNQVHSTLREEGEKAQTISDPNKPIRLGDLDPLAVGMEFVLALERPCVDHLYPHPDTAHEVGGHALTVSGQLAPAYPKSVFESHGAHETFCREVPEQSLHSLLALSSELCAESEITPIQVWQYIRSQPLFGGLEAPELWHLVEKLRDTATCYGFGAVIKREIFEKLMFETLLVGRAF